AALRQLGAIKTLPAARRAAIASALYDLGDGVGAGQYAQAAMSGDIADLDGYDAVVRVLAKTGRDDLARAALQKAAALGNTSPEGQRTLARMSAGLAVGQADRLRLNGQFAQAFDVLRGAWGAAPDNLEIMAALARLYQSGGMAARAAQTFQIVLTRDGRNRDALLGLAQTAQAAGDKELSQSAANRALQAFPQDYQVRMTLAQVAQARGDRSAAVRLLKEARALYSRQSGSNGIDAFGGNPFAADPMGVGTGNPFRDQPAMQAQPQINPFALGSGTRLPSAQMVPMNNGFGAPPAYAAPASYAAPHPMATRPPMPRRWRRTVARSWMVRVVVMPRRPPRIPIRPRIPTRPRTPIRRNRPIRRRALMARCQARPLAGRALARRPRLPAPRRSVMRPRHWRAVARSIRSWPRFRAISLRSPAKAGRGSILAPRIASARARPGFRN
ncbi:tetratricopeptide repeat protein, partial [Novosphingobium sp. B-7]|uniref:tetratricopeptide repeat protein n=1 Tax=Novosphingobium sp. B-7 TaxID=1298855 RepID=UPI0035288A05